jgi:thiol-disulfide isomerase/thioredoxin
MKKYFSIALTLFLITGSIFSQGKIPPFRMMQVNGKIFKAENLPVGKPVVIIYFSPDCEECQKLTGELLGRMDNFMNVTFAMITYQPVENVKKYVIKNKLNNYSNIFIGTEGSSLFVRNWYNIMTFPYLVLFNAKGEMITKYNTKEVDLDDLYSRVRMLK